MPSLLTAGINDDDAQTRATSSITMHVATESAPWPSYSSGTWTAEKPDVVQRFERLVREPRILVDVGRVRRDLLFTQRAKHLAELVVLIGQLEQIKLRITRPIQP